MFEIFNSAGVSSSAENLFRMQMVQSIAICLASAVKCLHVARAACVHRTRNI